LESTASSNPCQSKMQLKEGPSRLPGFEQWQNLTSVRRVIKLSQQEVM